MVYIVHIIKLYLVLKKKEILSYATECMKLEDIMLGEVRQSQKGKYCMISLK